MPRIAAVGNANVDISVFLPGIPGPDEDTDAERASLSVGGSASNFASTCALLGEESAILAVVGDDPLGAVYRREISSRGVDVNLIEVVPGAQTGFVVILNVAGSQRRMIRYRGANLLLGKGLTEERVEALRSAEVVHASSVSPEVVGTLVEAGLRLSWDPGWTAITKSKESVVELLKTGLIFRAFFNEKEAASLTGSGDLELAARLVHELGVDEVVVKMGEAGSAALESGGWVRAPAIRVRAVDTTGAGDVFDGAYTVARLKGLGTREALMAANYAAGKTVEVPGAVRGLPTWNEILSAVGRPT